MSKHKVEVTDRPATEEELARANALIAEEAAREEEDGNVEVFASWGNSCPPPEPTMTYSQHFEVLERLRSEMEQKYRDDMDYRDDSRKAAALNASIEYLEKGKTPETVVSTAKAFYDFLRGAT